jgi:selenocysteine-specific elongation factor
MEKSGELTIKDFKELTGLSRKFIIPVIEYLDKSKITLRMGDKRVLRKPGS